MTPARDAERESAEARGRAPAGPLSTADTLRIGPDTLVTDRAGGPELGDDALALLRAATRPGGTGCILLALSRTFGSCAAGGRQFVPEHTRTAAARWEAAVAELVGAGLLEPPAPPGCLYRVRSAGYELVARLT
jgi:hypothetical protein